MNVPKSMCETCGAILPRLEADCLRCRRVVTTREPDIPVESTEPERMIPCPTCRGRGRPAEWYVWASSVLLLAMLIRMILWAWGSLLWMALVLLFSLLMLIGHVALCHACSKCEGRGEIAEPSAPSRGPGADKHA